MKKNSVNKIYQLLAFVATIATCFSCSDEFFKEDAGNRITPGEHYQSWVDLDISIAGAVIPLRNTMPNLILIDGLRSDLMDVTLSADGYMNEINEQVFSSANPYLDPSDIYKVIINVNEILNNIDRVAKVDPSFNEFILHSYKGSLIGLRAWAYFTFVQLYGKAPIIKDNLASLPENMEQEYISKEEMIDTLINQLVPYIHTDTKLVEVTTIVNTKALLGELYLEKNDYLNAAKYLKLAMESYENSTSVYKVDKSFAKVAWKNIFLNSDNIFSENIFVISFNSKEGQTNPLAGWMLYSDKFMVKPSQNLVHSFKTQIQTKDDIGDVYRGKGVTFDSLPGSNDSYYISKYSLDNSEPYSTDIIALRAADVHLLLAEALNRIGDTKTALILLNNGFNAEKDKPEEYNKWSSNIGIRGRVFLAPKLVPNDITDPVAITETIENMIIEERAMELAYEGRRWFDLVRIAKRRGDPAFLADKVAAKFTDPGKASMIQNKLMNQENWYLPLK